jgi:hypothetical protein
MRIENIFLFIIIFLPIVCLTDHNNSNKQASNPLKIYLSPNGSSQNPGTKNEPLKTLTQARDKIRAYKATHTIMDTIFVIVQNGFYKMDAPLRLSPKDSGTPQYPVIYKAAPGSRPVFSGGQKIAHFHVDQQGRWHTRLDLSASPWNGNRFDQLYINGKRAQLAHSPNKGYYRIQKVNQKILKRGNGRIPKRALQTLSFTPKAFKELKSLKPVAMTTFRFRAYQNWDMMIRYIDKINPNSMSLTTTGKGMKPWNPLKKGTRVRFENYPAALDSAGEWYLSKNGELSYIPHSGENPKESKVIAPVLPYFIKIQGQPKNNKYVQYIKFKGLTFTYSRYTIGPKGFDPNQAAASIPAAIKVEGAKYIVFSHCNVQHTGQHAIWFRKDCRYDIVKQCYLHDLGGGGIYIGTTQAVPDSILTEHIIVKNNIIQSGGLIFAPAIGVWIGKSAYDQVLHNDIGDFRYTGISVGWHWGYGQTPDKDNMIEYNHIHQIGWGVLSDMGGIYTLGPQKGTVVSHNVINDVYSYSYGGWGLYADEGSSYIKWKDNLVYYTKSGGFHQHYGKQNIISNNIFAFASKEQLKCDPVKKSHSSLLALTFDHNIVVYNNGRLLLGPWNKLNINMDHNLYWRYDKNPVLFLGRTFAKWQQQTGHDIHSIIKRPDFQSPQKLNFHLLSQKAIDKIDFQPFNYKKAGVFGSKVWKAKARLPESRIEQFQELFTHH